MTAEVLPSKEQQENSFLTIAADMLQARVEEAEKLHALKEFSFIAAPIEIALSVVEIKLHASKELLDITSCISNALNAGASQQDILKVLAFFVGNETILLSIIEVLRALRFEESKRNPYLSIIEDCKEE